jgi:hypothetical protein
VAPLLPVCGPVSIANNCRTLLPQLVFAVAVVGPVVCLFVVVTVVVVVIVVVCCRGRIIVVVVVVSLLVRLGLPDQL